jgi:hypothetical protein
MDPIERYLELLRKLAASCVDDARSSMDFLADAEKSEDGAEVVSLRRELVDEADRLRVAPYLTSGYFPARDPQTRIALFAICLELEHECERFALKRECEPYSPSQPLFVALPTLWNRVRNPDKEADLLNVEDLAWDPTSQLLHLDQDQRVRLSEHLRPDCARFLRTEVPSRHLFFRFNPYHVGTQVPLLLEAAIRPAAPHWWRELKVFPGRVEAARYDLSGENPRVPQDYWDYHARKIRRLEVAFCRDHGGLLHGSIEEISSLQRDVLFGLMLHFDSSAPVGTEWEAATLGHLDGAINVYLGRDSGLRFQQSHEGGKVQDATFRTHLFRADDVPLRLLVPVMASFLRSTQLLREWHRDFFR